ncbi:hypothetical protein HORIV_60940 [Vreelandella olivaria]|uniref:Uncharacterized protein n=1 Tax=Vreelandella olivaria TaxID=390919 RepID=A0ABN5X4B5_9GAMM|nr:hypothetical protein HORIV_60940 [Halomonas olivaria]
MWAWMIAATKVLHNYLGPIFGILLVILLVSLIKDNIPKSTTSSGLRKVAV